MLARTAVVIGVLVWLACFVLALDDVVRGAPTFPGGLQSVAAEGQGLRLDSVLPAGRSGDLRPGDRILQLGDVDVRNVQTHSAYHEALFRAGQGGDRIAVLAERGDSELRTEVVLLSHRRFWPRLVASLVFGVCAAILGFGGRGQILARLFCATYLVTAVFLTVTFVGSALETAIVRVAYWGSLILMAPLSLITFLHMDESRETSVGTWVWPWLFAVFAPLDSSRFGGGPFPAGISAIALACIALIFSGICVVLLARAHREASPLFRRKLRWILLGIYLALFVATIPEVLAASNPSLGRYTALTISGLAVLPICVLIGIFRYRFLDIDRVWTVVLSGSLLVVGLVVSSQTVLPAASDALQEASGASDTAATAVVMIVSIAACLPLVAAVIFVARKTLLAEHWDFRTGVDQLVSELTVVGSPSRMARSATDELYRLFEPRSSTMYLRENDSLVPVAHAGAGSPVPQPVGGPLVAALADQSGVISLAREARAFGRIGRFQRAALESLNAPLVAPLFDDEELVGFVCLGERRSGDIYTATDEGLLRLVADKLAGELRAFRQNERIHALKPFHPAGPAARPGRTEASVLFVDIRGYSKMTAGLGFDELRDLVGKFSDTAAAVIKAHGGEIYAWSGDELMGLFGAWGSLEEKATASVAAARSILESLAQLEDSRTPLSVGIGIATGEVYLDAVSAGDRRFSAALGQTTNLASKLQKLTREIDAAVAIDQTTWRQCGSGKDAFLPYLNRNVPGISEAQDVFVLPLEAGRDETGAS